MGAKQVRIKSCSDSQRWYAKQIGRWFELRHIDSDGVWVVDHQGFINCVSPNDAFVLEPDHDC